jgi:hypothetical protein
MVEYKEAGITLFAVIIFSFALVSLMTIAGKGVIATATAKDQLTAQYLAEEGVEVARNMRDSNFISQNSWLDNELGNCIKDAPCDVDYSNHPVLKTIDGETTSALYQNGGTFSPDATIGGDIPQRFYRKIYLDPIDGSDFEKIIVSEITWKQKDINRSFVLKTYISNWQESSTPVTP